MIESRGEDLLAQDMAAWEEHLLRRWGLPEQALVQGQVSHYPSYDTRAVWGPRGGVVSCQDPDLARDLAAALRLSDWARPEDAVERIREVFSRRDVGGAWAVDHSLLWRSSLGPLPRVEAKVVRFLADKGEVGTDLPEEVEHVLALFRGCAVVSWVSNIPVLRLRDHWIHSLRVETISSCRRQGLAKSVVAAMLDHLASENAAALWVCRATNVASWKLARSLGFLHHCCTLNWRM
jgi:ribosomal protein S18 acetylase RimI-like enzyme